MSLHKLQELVMVREVSWLGKSMGFQRVGHDWGTELNLRWGRSPGGGNGNLLQYSCLKNPIDRGAWWTTVHRSQRVVQDWATVHTHTHTQKCTFLQFLNTTSSSFWPIWFLVRTLFQVCRRLPTTSLNGFSFKGSWKERDICVSSSSSKISSPIRLGPHPYGII